MSGAPFHGECESFARHGCQRFFWNSHFARCPRMTGIMADQKGQGSLVHRFLWEPDDNHPETIDERATGSKRGSDSLPLGNCDANPEGIESASPALDDAVGLRWVAPSRRCSTLKELHQDHGRRCHPGNARAIRLDSTPSELRNYYCDAFPG
jgi:hypothetical protein